MFNRAGVAHETPHLIRTQHRQCQRERKRQDAVHGNRHDSAECEFHQVRVCGEQLIDANNDTQELKREADDAVAHEEHKILLVMETDAVGHPRAGDANAKSMKLHRECVSVSQWVTHV